MVSTAITGGTIGCCPAPHRSILAPLSLHCREAGKLKNWAKYYPSKSLHDHIGAVILFRRFSDPRHSNTTYMSAPQPHTQYVVKNITFGLAPMKPSVEQLPCMREKRCELSGWMATDFTTFCPAIYSEPSSEKRFFGPSTLTTHIRHWPTQRLRQHNLSPERKTLIGLFSGFCVPFFFR
jgi:hypothetical protein